MDSKAYSRALHFAYLPSRASVLLPAGIGIRRDPVFGGADTHFLKLVADDTNFLAMFEVLSERESCNESMSRGVQAANIKW